MAGIYVHIPFCRSRCIYCGFYSTTDLEMRQKYVERLCDEMDERRNYLPDAVFDTIYIGGGTPSQLTPSQLVALVLQLYEVFPVSPSAEFTIEMNPDDVSAEYLENIRELPFNRVSLGIQTFSDERLRFLHRRHDSYGARKAVQLCRENGIDNISVDLMFGFPGETLEEWKSDVEAALDLEVNHISAYSLMYEEDTPLIKMLERGDIVEISDELSCKMYDYLCDRLSAKGYQHYEISNFCKPGFHSRHNSSYWDGTPYIGLGAGAHSFDGKERQWNGKFKNGEWKMEGKEVLTKSNCYNEIIMTGLRTRRGISLTALKTNYPDFFQQSECQFINHLKNSNLVHDAETDTIRLTRQGIHISNTIMADLMIIE